MTFEFQKRATYGYFTQGVYIMLAHFLYHSPVSPSTPVAASFIEINISRINCVISL